MFGVLLSKAVRKLIFSLLTRHDQQLRYELVAVGNWVPDTDFIMPGFEAISNRGPGYSGFSGKIPDKSLGPKPEMEKQLKLVARIKII